MKNKLKIGDKVQGEIIDFTHEGNGVLKVDDFIVFLSGGLIGDIVAGEIDQVKKNFATGNLSEIIEPSKDRIDFQTSESKAGIPLIEYDYAKQLEWKKEKVEKDFARIANLEDIEIKDMIGMENTIRYRNHVQIPVGSKNGKTIIGFYEAGSNDIVEMDETILQPETGNKVMNIVKAWMEKYEISSYNKLSKKGIMRHIGIRINKDGEIMLILVTGSNELPNIDELIEMLEDENVVSIYQNINKANSPVTYGRKYIKIHGEDKIIDYIGDYKFELSPNSFFQINRLQAEVLYNKVEEYLDLKEEDVVYDLYSGIGTISLYIAEKAKQVYGIEIVEKAIEDAKKNAILNYTKNVDFILGRSELIFPKYVKNNVKANKVVIDPPRKGCEKEVLESIVKLGPEKVVYVSCNPTTMARDIKYLVENGYKVKEVQPIDMFPHTSHIECVVRIQKIQ